MKKLAFVILVVLVVLGCGGSVLMEGHMPDGEGVYRCASEFPGSRVYRFDTRHKESVVWLGTESGIGFVDLETGKRVRLREDNMNYICAPDTEHEVALQ